MSVARIKLQVLERRKIKYMIRLAKCTDIYVGAAISRILQTSY